MKRIEMQFNYVTEVRNLYTSSGSVNKAVLQLYILKYIELNLHVRMKCYL